MPPRRVLFTLLAAVLFLASGASRAAAQSKSADSFGKPDLVISGEVSAGNSFERDIGQGLLFRLVPTPDGFGKGWDIQIVPKENPAGGYAEYSAIVTPPYHFYNLRYLNPSYGVTAKEAVGISPRAFQFVETPAESQAAYEVVNSVVYSVDWEQHKDSIAAAAAKIPVGTAELKILGSRITPGKNNEDLGSIDWVKFEVRFRFHSETLLQVLFPDYVAPR